MCVCVCVWRGQAGPAVRLQQKQLAGVSTCMRTRCRREGKGDGPTTGPGEDAARAVPLEQQGAPAEGEAGLGAHLERGEEELAGRQLQEAHALQGSGRVAPRVALAQWLGPARDIPALRCRASQRASREPTMFPCTQHAGLRRACSATTDASTTKYPRSTHLRRHWCLQKHHEVLGENEACQDSNGSSQGSNLRGEAGRRAGRRPAQHEVVSCTPALLLLCWQFHVQHQLQCLNYE